MVYLRKIKNYQIDGQRVYLKSQIQQISANEPIWNGLKDMMHTRMVYLLELEITDETDEIL